MMGLWTRWTVSEKHASRRIRTNIVLKSRNARESSPLAHDDAKMFLEETPLCPRCLAEVYNLQFCPSCHEMLVEENHSGC